MIYLVTARNVDDVDGEELTAERWRWTIQGARRTAEEWARFFGDQAIITIVDGSGRRIR